MDESNQMKRAMVSNMEILNYGTLDRYDEATIRAALKQRFEFKQWDEGKIERGKQVTNAFIEAAFAVIVNVPPCPTRTRVLNEIEVCRMMANAAITHDGSF